MNILYILVCFFFGLSIGLFVLFINSNKELIKVILATASLGCLLVAMSYMTEQHRFSYDDGSLRHLGIEYYHMNGNGTTTNSITGETFVSEVVPTMYGTHLELYKDSKRVNVLILHK